MRKVGILGGTFDPIHNGHIAIAQDAAIQVGLDVVFFMPAAQSPFKKHQPLASDSARYKMIQMAIEDHPKFEVLDWELLKKGISYTIDTVHILKKNWPNTHFYWIIGNDLLESLPNWKNINELAKLIDFIVVQRSKNPPKAPLNIPNLKIHTINNPICNISSSEIRQKISKQEPIDELLPTNVKNYILIHKLYHG